MIHQKIRILKSFLLAAAFLIVSFLDVELRQKNICLGILLAVFVLMLVWDFIIRPYSKRERNTFFFFSGISLLIGLGWVVLFLIRE